MSLWIIIDIIVIAIYVLAVLYFKSKGFLKASETLISIILTFCLMPFTLPFFEGVIADSPVGTGVYEKVEEAIMTSEAGKDIALPDFMQNVLQDKLQDIDATKDNLLKVTAEYVTDLIIKVISVILLFIIIKLGIFVIFKILSIFCNIKLFGFVNSTLGMVMGFVNATIIVYIACALAIIFVPVENYETVKEIMSQTYITGFFYNNNILIDLLI